MSKLLKIFAICIFLVSCSNGDENNLEITTETNQIKYNIETARSQEELEKGLMDREVLAENSGMIFDVRALDSVAFWMKDTYIPLDMLFVDSNGTIVWIYQNAEATSEEIIISPVVTDFVVEINAGDIEKHNIQLGDKIKHTWIKN